jgi:hypothetical protein
VIGLLALPAVAKRLLENPVFVPQSGADAGNAERRHRVQEAGGEPAQAAVAKSGVGFFFGDGQRIELVLLPQGTEKRIEHQVGDVVRQRPSHQKLERQVVDALHISRLVGLLRLDPSLRQDVPDREGDGLEPVARSRCLDRRDVIERQVTFVESVVTSGERDRSAVESLEDCSLCCPSAFLHWGPAALMSGLTPDS